MFLLYRTLTTILFPLFVVVIYLRKILGKEDKIRFKEKIFLPKEKKTKKKTLWFHGASIGEIMSIVPLINHLNKQNFAPRILITSVTLSSGKIIQDKFKDNQNVFHKYFPLDTPYLAKKFINNWSPDFVGFVDSEIWPNFIFEIKNRKIPLILINARITKKTYLRWMLLKKFSKKIFSSFDLCLASSKNSFEYLHKLKAKNIKLIGNLKYYSENNTAEKLSENTLAYFSKRKVWCAASTHSGEEGLCIEVHKRIKEKYKDILTIIIPRHISRTNEIYLLCKKNNLITQIFNENNKINENTEVILVNSFGTLTKYFHYCKSVFIGKSSLERLQSVAGQNPIEAAKQSCKIYYGPFVYNFLEVYEYLNSNKMAEQIKNSKDLSENIITDFKEPKNINSEKIQKIEQFGKKIFTETLNEINKFIK